MRFLGKMSYLGPYGLCVCESWKYGIGIFFAIDKLGFPELWSIGSYQLENFLMQCWLETAFLGWQRMLGIQEVGMLILLISSLTRCMKKNRSHLILWYSLLCTKYQAKRGPLNNMVSMCNTSVKMTLTSAIYHYVW